MSASVPLSVVFADSTAALGLDPVADQSTGGGIAWGFGELPIVMVATIVFAQWVRADTRAASRVDRQAQRDDQAALTAYNRALATLAGRASTPTPLTPASHAPQPQHRELQAPVPRPARRH